MRLSEICCLFGVYIFVRVVFAFSQRSELLRVPGRLLQGPITANQNFSGRIRNHRRTPLDPAEFQRCQHRTCNRIGSYRGY